MIIDLLIEDFKGIKSLRFDSLQRVNLIAGANDVGKTSVLEALYFISACDPALIHAFPNIFRNGKGDEKPLSDKDQMVHFWGWLVHQGAEAGKIVVSTDSKSQVTLTFGSKNGNAWAATTEGLKIRLSSDAGRGPFDMLIQPGGGSSSQGQAGDFLPKAAVLSTHPSSPITDAKLYNTAALRAGAEATIENVLRVIEPRLNRLRFLQAPETSMPLVHADVSGIKRLVPSSQMGQGFNRVLNICCQIMAAQAEVILVDEIENGIHHDALPKIWNGIKQICREAGVQLFATTHSLECIRAAHEAYSTDDRYDFALHRLQRVKGAVEVVTHSREMLEISLNAPSPIEVR